MSEADLIRETIELTDFLSTEQIKKIIDMAIRHGPGGYEARLDIQLLLDEMKARGFDVTNRFEAKGNEVLPSGTYEFMYENDLGDVNGTCQNYGCGHPIRYEEHIKHLATGREFVVGNVCVERILGEHDLIHVAVSLLARMSGKIDRMAKADKCEAICGAVLRTVMEIDPKHWFTHDEYLFLEAISGQKSGLTLKKAEEFRDRWTPDKMHELEGEVRRRKDWADRDNAATGTRSRWLEFLDHKARTSSVSDFIANCVAVTKEQGMPTPGQRSALQAEYDRFWMILGGDEAVLEPLQGVFKYFGRKLLKHSAKCRSHFHIGLIEQLLNGRDLTYKQVEALSEGCHICNWKLD